MIVASRRIASTSFTSNICFLERKRAPNPVLPQEFPLVHEVATTGQRPLSFHPVDFSRVDLYADCLATPWSAANDRWGRVGGAEVGLLAVAVEDSEDLDWAAVAGHPMRGHGVELGGVAGFDQEFALAEQ